MNIENNIYNNWVMLDNNISNNENIVEIENNENIKEIENNENIKEIEKLCNEANFLTNYLSNQVSKGNSFFSLTRFAGQLGLSINYEKQFQQLEKTIKDLGSKLNEQKATVEQRKSHLNNIKSLISRAQPSDFHNVEMDRLNRVAQTIDTIIHEGSKKEEIIIESDDKLPALIIEDKEEIVIESDDVDDVKENDKLSVLDSHPEHKPDGVPLPPGPGVPPPPGPPPPVSPKLSEEDKLKKKQEKIDQLNEEIETVRAQMDEIAESLQSLVGKKCEKASQRTDARKSFGDAARNVESWKSSKYDCSVNGYGVIIKDLENLSSSIEIETKKLKLMQADLNNMKDADFCMVKGNKVSKSALQQAIEQSSQNIEKGNKQHIELQNLRNDIDNAPFGFAANFEEYTTLDSEVNKLIDDVKNYQTLASEVEQLERKMSKLKGVKSKPLPENKSDDNAKADMMAQLRDRLQQRNEEKVAESLSPNEIGKLYD